jgi:hypothetical protein
MMAQMQDLFVPLGLSRKEAMGMSKSVASLAVDIASFNNVSDADAMRDISSALIGQTESVRKYGIMIGEAEVQQAALDSGLYKTVDAMTMQEKVQMRLKIIQDSSKDAMGDAIRTGDSYANQLKRMEGNITNLSTALGQTFVPMVNKAVTAINQWLQGGGQEKIVAWAQKAVAYVTWFAERFSAIWDNSTMTDMLAGTLDAALELIKAFAKAAIVVAVGIGAGIWKAVTENLFGDNAASDDKHNRIQARSEAVKERGTGFDWNAPGEKEKFESQVNARTAELNKESASKRGTDSVLAPYLSASGDILKEGMVNAGRAFEAHANKTQEYTDRVAAADAALANGLTNATGQPGKNLPGGNAPGLDAPDKPTVHSAVTVEMIKFAEELKKNMLTPAEKFAEVTKMMDSLLKEKLLTPEEYAKGMKYEKDKIMGKADTDKSRGEAINASLVSVSGLAIGGTSAELQEMRKQTAYLSTIANKKGME